MIEIGRLNNLKVIKEVDFGIYLDGEDLGNILLPKKYVPENTKIDDIIEVFISFDSEDRILATTQLPYVMIGEFGLLRVVSLSNFGAFLDWGLLKDLLVPFSEQKIKMEMGRSYIVRVYLDELTNRIVGSSNLDKFVDKYPSDYLEGDEVDILITKKTDLGYKAIINDTHWGVLYENEIFQPLKIGQKLTGFIKKIRDDDKIDLTLQKSGYKKVEDLSDRILDLIKQNNGFIDLTDTSSPEEIYEALGVSKKTFKKAIGALYKERMISIGDAGIRLLKTIEDD
jgi:predicted RNA-binding protein (virulence factor B family)